MKQATLATIPSSWQRKVAGPAPFRKFLFQETNYSLISVTEFTYINRHEKNKIKEV
jgi:hypothetical protein